MTIDTPFVAAIPLENRCRPSPATVVTGNKTGCWMPCFTIKIPLPTPERRYPPAIYIIAGGSRCTQLSIQCSMMGRSRSPMKWLDAPLSAVIVKLTLLLVEKAAMKEYPMPCGGVACRVVAGVAVTQLKLSLIHI